MLKPQLDFKVSRVLKVELAYLQLIYAIIQIRKQGENAQGYFFVTNGEMLNRLSQFEHDYRGKEYAEVLRVSLDSFLRRTVRAEKTGILSGIVRAAILDTNDAPSTSSSYRSMREFILAETIVGLEPDVRHLKDESRFPFRVGWDYYGVVEN